MVPVQKPFFAQPQWVHPSSPPLDTRNNFLDVWKFSLDSDNYNLEKLKKILNKEELTESCRFKQDIHQIQYIIAHAVTKMILGRYFNTTPSEIQIQKNPFGKPIIKETNISTSIEFNLTHSHQLALVAVSNKAVGVDLELVDDNPQKLDEVSRISFTEEEKHFIFSQPTETQTLWFYAHWVAKEAFLKGLGMGLNRNPLEVTLKFALESPSTPSLIFAGKPIYGWNTLVFHAGEDYLGAAVFKTSPQKLHFFRYENG